MKDPLCLLALDTSSPQGGLALVQQKTAAEACCLLAERSWNESSSHSDIITQEVELLLKSAGLSVKDLTAVALGLGPGSFTGIRVGVNFARSLGYSLDLPIIGLNSLQILAFNGLEFLKAQTEIRHILCLTNAFRNKLYAAIYGIDMKNGTHPLLEILPPQAVSPRDLPALLPESRYLCLGNGFEAYQESFPADLPLKILRRPEISDSPQASALAQWALAYGKSRPWTDIKPLYIRASEPEEKLKTTVS